MRNTRDGLTAAQLFDGHGAEGRGSAGCGLERHDDAVRRGSRHLARNDRGLREAVIAQEKREPLARGRDVLPIAWPSGFERQRIEPLGHFLGGGLEAGKGNPLDDEGRAFVEADAQPHRGLVVIEVDRHAGDP